MVRLTTPFPLRRVLISEISPFLVLESIVQLVPQFFLRPLWLAPGVVFVEQLPCDAVVRYSGPDDNTGSPHGLIVTALSGYRWIDFSQIPPASFLGRESSIGSPESGPGERRGRGHTHMVRFPVTLDLLN